MSTLLWPRNKKTINGMGAYGPRPKTCKGERSVQKLLAKVFWDIHSVICVDFLHRETTVTTEVQRHSRNFREELLEFYLEDTCKGYFSNKIWHTSNMTREVITLFGWTTRSHQPYSPDLAPSDYHLFGPLKSELRGNHYKSYDKVKFAVTSWFKSQPEEWYRSWYKGWFKVR